MSDNEQPKKDWASIVEDVAPPAEVSTVAPEAEAVVGILDHPSYKELEKRLLEAETERDKQRDLALRTASDMENSRRRAERDLENTHKYAIERLARELLPVMDSLEHALTAAVEHEGLAAMREGIELTLKMFDDVLAKFAIKPIVAQGAVFDPNFHEAMAQQEQQGVAPGTVLHVFQKGYCIHDRVLRPARVIVAKA